MKFENKLKFRGVFGVIILISGIIIEIIGVMKYLILEENNIYSRAYYTFGITFICFGFVILNKNFSLFFDKDKREKLKVEEQDERNVLIIYKSGHYTFVVSIILLFVAALYLFLIHSTLFEPLLIIGAVIAAMNLFIRFIVRKTN